MKIINKITFLSHIVETDNGKLYRRNTQIDTLGHAYTYWENIKHEAYNHCDPVLEKKLERLFTQKNYNAFSNSHIQHSTY